MDIVGDRQTVNIRGTTCTETEFRLGKDLPQTGDLTFRLDLAAGDDPNMTVFDYGVIMA